MALLDIFKTRQQLVNELYNEIEKVASIRKRQIFPSDRKSPSPSLIKPPIGTGKLKFVNKELERRIMRGKIYLNQYNMGDMLLAYQGEAYFKYAVDRYIESVLRNEWGIVSKNPKVTSYLNKRLNEVGIVGGMSMAEFFRDMLSQLLIYGNIFLAFERNIKSSTGKQYINWAGKKLQPISTFYVEDARKMSIGQNNAGKLVYIKIKNQSQMLKDWNYNPYNPSILPFTTGLSRLTVGAALNSRRTKTNNPNYRVFDIDCMKHIRYHHIPGAKWAMPPFHPVLLDIDTLRKIESNIELLMFQFGHVMLHAQVGDTNRPGTRAEIENVTNQLNNMAGNGFITTDNRVKIDALGAEGKAVRADGYLKYFKQRVLTGLWLSETGAGESGASRNTGDIIDEIRQDKTIELMQIVQMTMEPVLYELLLEAGRNVTIDWILRPENRPTLYFPEVDLAKKVTLENHIYTLYAGNLITASEARTKIGKDPLSENEWKDMYVERVTIPANKANKEGQLKAAQEHIKKTNQHGTKQGPTRRAN